MSNSQVIDAQQRFSQDQDFELVTQAQRGEQHAFIELYQRHHKRIYALCWRMLADKDSAEDICQEVFVQMWQKISHFRGDSKFSTWFHSVATNVVLNHLRKQKTWIQKVFSVEDKFVEEQTVVMSDHVEVHELDKHIQQLPERARIVFVLFAVEGYRHEEIASMTGMAVGSSKAQYHRAKTLLKEALSE
ncbi:RNA polymerase sigma factor [Thalassotalea sp. 1_MG-2023]|uniref:RNA polymerase sigma factor n=1 Tax=Thalassotalea sp. 1_MG-2023 TaxID=3062680 RepID=UPI0026E25D9D|nr:RNA polymerase sigma factor [Thalassotalea sp. 1_MG-2023]MDO6426182.1 RNA polymerase sigma factor [Thalassotalea sp. 1_MG-2023]